MGPHPLPLLAPQVASLGASLWSTPTLCQSATLSKWSIPTSTATSTGPAASWGAEGAACYLPYLDVVSAERPRLIYLLPVCLQHGSELRMLAPAVWPGLALVAWRLCNHQCVALHSAWQPIKPARSLQRFGICQQLLVSQPPRAQTSPRNPCPATYKQGSEGCAAALRLSLPPWGRSCASPLQRKPGSAAGRPVSTSTW